MRPQTPHRHLCEAEVVEGLAHLAARELERRHGDRVELIRPEELGDQTEGVQFEYAGRLRALLSLQTAQAVYLVSQFPIARPRALLGDEHFRRILRQIDTVVELGAGAPFRSFRIAAAGSDSPVMRRLKEQIQRHTGLATSDSEADLHIRIRRALYGQGWEVLVRLSPRPLATRAWRVCNYEGALNATIAAAMVMLTEPKPDDTFLNVACGSGTLLIERLSFGPVGRAIGCDVDPRALECARANVQASGHDGRVELQPWDARSLPLPRASVDALCADLPFGHLVGSREENLRLYPLILREAARVARPGAPFVLISHEVKLLDSLLRSVPVRGVPEWEIRSTFRVSQRGFGRRVFVLRRVGEASARMASPDRLP